MLSISLLYLFLPSLKLIFVSLVDPTVIAAFVGLTALSVFLLIGVMRRKVLREYADRRFSSIFSANPLPAWVVDLSSGKILNVNGAALNRYSFTREEFLQKKLSSLIPGHISDTPAAGKGVMIREYETPTVCTHIAGDGTELSVTLHSETLLLKGKPTLVVYTLDAAEKTRSEEALRTSEKRIKQLFDNSPFAVILVRVDDLKIADVNAAFTALTGWDKGLVVGNTLGESGLFITENFVFPAEQLKTHGSLNEVEVEIQTPKNGSLKVTAGASPFELQGELHSIITLIDRTDRLLVNDFRRQSDERLRIVTENARVGLVIINPDRIYTFTNAAYPEIFGIQPEKIVGRSVSDVHGRLYEEQIEHRLDRAFEGERISFELHQRTGKGDRFFAVRYEPTYTGDEVSLVVEVTTDVTEKYESELARQASEERYHTLFEYAPDGILIADPDSNYIDANQTMCRMLGHERDELIGRNAADIIVPREIPHTGDVLRGLNAELDYFRDWQFRRKDQTIFPAEVIANRMPDGNTLAVVRDISERKHLENQLLQAQKMEAIGVLAGGIAHDFNNLLNAIIGFSDLSLEKTAEDDARYHYLQQIRGAGQRAATLTQKILAFGRKQILVPEVHNLNDSIKGMEPLLRHLVKESVEFNFDLEGNLGNVKADSGQIEQVIMNLIVNAQDAMPNGGTVTIRTRNIDLPRDADGDEIGITPGRYIKMSVADTGTGMDDDTMRRLFEPFFTTKAIGKGTGLGLSIAYGIVKQSDGEIRIESSPGKGSVFSIYLPMFEREAKITEAPKTVKAARSRTGETILLVEDDPAVRNYVFQVLIGNGFKVLEAESGEAALAIAQVHAGPIHMLLTDVVMPGMDGLELRNRLAGSRPGLPVLFMSGYTDDTIPIDKFSEITGSFIEKPFIGAALLEKIAILLGDSQEVPNIEDANKAPGAASTAAIGKTY